MSGAPSLPSELPRRAALGRLEAAFAAAGLPEPAADARILLEEATGLTRFALLAAADAPLGTAAAARLEAWTRRRLSREPVFRILGTREFWGLRLRVTPAVLDPRPDTETLVAAVARAAGARREAPLRILDLGTGSGSLLCALLSLFPQATGLGIDRSPEACAVAAANLQGCGLAGRGSVREGDWGAGLSERYDIVVSNPPYIAAGEIAALAPEVREHDPRLALDGGPDGLAAYRVLCADLPRLLAEGGLAGLEVGWTQADAVAALLAAAGLERLERAHDLAGHARALLARPRGAAVA